jgi:hypothetical protein
LRERLDAIFREWRAPFASCIAAAQAAGEIDSQLDATELAEFLLASWEGAILRMKVERHPAALERFKHIMFETVFKGPGTSDVATTQRTNLTVMSDGPAKPRADGESFDRAIGGKP